MIHINIGSNLGDRLLNIERAVAAVEAAFGAKAIRSEIVESDPWGYNSPNRFANIGIAFRTPDVGLDPTPENALAILDSLRDIEKRMGSLSHRNPDGSYADRVIDIDFIAWDDLIVDLKRLTLPHPRFALRDFVTGPMRQIDPDCPWLPPQKAL